MRCATHTAVWQGAASKSMVMSAEQRVPECTQQAYNAESFTIGHLTREMWAMQV
jgi:hypothetical protein